MENQNDDCSKSDRMLSDLINRGLKEFIDSFRQSNLYETKIGELIVAIDKQQKRLLDVATDRLIVALDKAKPLRDVLLLKDFHYFDDNDETVLIGARTRTRHVCLSADNTFKPLQCFAALPSRDKKTALIFSTSVFDPPGKAYRRGHVFELNLTTLRW
jgi:hypothetical protein